MLDLDIEAISGIFGSVSIACWVVVFSPQIIENFRRSSAEGLSIVFLVIWLAGDVFNILGAVLQGVLPTMIILAIYYTLADIVLLAQCFYYRGFTLRDPVPTTTPPTAGLAGSSVEGNGHAGWSTDTAIVHDSATVSDAAIEITAPSETSPLLPSEETVNAGLRPERARRPSSAFLSTVDGTHLSPATPLHHANRDELALQAKSPAQRTSVIKSIFYNLTAVLVVCAAGVLGWCLSTQTRQRQRGDEHHRHKHRKEYNKAYQELEFNVLGQVFGYTCTALYLGSRIPQLLLNFRRKSTEGLSLLFFIFACLGNLTFVCSIIAYEPVCYSSHYCEAGEFRGLYKRNILVNFPWLLGSIGNLLQDAAVFVQYFIYRSSKAGPPTATAPA